MDTPQSLLAAQASLKQARRAFAALVRKYREERLNMPIETLAERADNLSPTTLSGVETNARSPRRRTYEKLLAVFAADARLTPQDLDLLEETYDAFEDAEKHYRQLAAKYRHWQQISPGPATPAVQSPATLSGPDQQKQREPTDDTDRPEAAVPPEESDTVPEATMRWEPDEASETGEEPEAISEAECLEIEQPNGLDQTMHLDITEQQGHELERRGLETKANEGPQNQADEEPGKDRREQDADHEQNRSPQPTPSPLCPPPDSGTQKEHAAESEPKDAAGRSPDEDSRQIGPSAAEESIRIHPIGGSVLDGDNGQVAAYRAHGLVLVPPPKAHGQDNQIDQGGDDMQDLRNRVRQGIAARPAWLDTRWAKVGLIAGSVVLIGLLILGIWSLVAGGDSSPQYPSETIGSGQCVNAPAGAIVVGRVTVNGVAQYTTDAAGATTGWIIQLNRAATVCAPMSEGAVVQGVGDNQDTVARVLVQDVQQLQTSGCVVNQGCQRVVTIRYPYP